jgi:small subunit ribosomal protein S8
MMVSTDPIADMITRIRNSIAVNKNMVNLPHSIAKERVAKILVEAGFLEATHVDEDNERKILSITINADQSSPAITNIKRLSKPGRRHYVKADRIPTVKRGRGIVVISTSGGVMTGNEAKAKRLGGELICEVY